MQYIEAKKGLALAAGFSLRGHRHNDTGMILNEKEVMFQPSLSSYSTLQEKAAALEGTVHSHHEILQILKNYE